MAPHSSTLAWKIPWTEEPGGLQPIGSLSQTQEDKYYMISLICGIYKKATNELIYKTEVESQM